MAEKHFTKSNTHFDKNSQNIRIKENFMNLLKGIFEKEKERRNGADFLKALVQAELVTSR